MVSAYYDELRRGFSADRLSKYQPDGTIDFDAAVNYFWNMALSEALYASLGALEVTLRNAIHNAASRRFQTEYWFDTPQILKYRQPGDVVKARFTLTRENKPHTAGRIVAELSFGFWTTLLSDPYHSSFWMADRAWMLKETFPHMPNSQRVRNQIYARYNSLRLLRNRIFHFEPIWHRPNLAQQHAQILEAIGWVNPTVRRSLGIIDHFPETYERGQRIIAEMLKDHLDFPEAHPL